MFRGSKIFITVVFIICLFVTQQALIAAQYSPQAMYTVVKGHDDQLKTIAARVNLLQDNYATLVRNVNSLKKELQEEKQMNARLQNTIDSLKQQISKDRQQMNQNLNNVINKVSEQTSRAINKVAKLQEAAVQASHQRNSSGGGPAGNGNFVEYTVQLGATLSAIAKAYNVNVSDIKKANRLNSDIIRVGQKLYIPQ